ncbi:hypothetical protein [Pseudoxanthomonas daejeonensis]|uniref:Uncharacterized protein n=1 Tax=Pseudoxanthomonas daejeonensis TaxID=266062 RepID=A0ABQ6Z974_9GAMM|nr:hypothetical protein [Pseudoxanthomonas daejeonensis]KAF1696037.1 hypothetical protein CSC65_05940 [Pseudoxanthomonas daejeonensis]
MSALTDYEKNELSLGRRYRQYEHAYNAAFAADPNPQARQFNETAARDDIQWKRLETFRGNDKGAYHAHQSNPSDPLAKPTEKEAAAWQANQVDQWRIEREPAFGQNDATNNKWLGLTPEARNSEKGQAFLAHVEQKHGAAYDAYAAKTGNNAVDRSDYLRTMGVVEAESMSARAQSQQQAPQQQAPQQQAAGKTQAAQEAATIQAPAPEVKKSRLNFADFSRPVDQQVDECAASMAKLSDKELDQTKQQAIQQHEVKGLGDFQEASANVESYNRVQSALQEARAARRQESLAEAQSRNRSQSQ